MEKFIWRNIKMLGILKNKNIKNIQTIMQDDNIIIEMELKNSIISMDNHAVYSAIYDFDDFIKIMFINDDKSYFSGFNGYEYELLRNNNKNDEQLLFTILHNYILSFKNVTVNYSYYGYYNKKITNNIFITYKANKNKIGIEVNKNIFNKDVFENWN